MRTAQLESLKWRTTFRKRQQKFQLGKNDFRDRKGRSTFATKVLVTVFLQFGCLAAMCNTFMYSFSDDILKWFANTGWFTMLIFGLSVPVILIVFLMKPNLMTQKPKNILSLIFLTLLLA